MRAVSVNSFNLYGSEDPLEEDRFRRLEALLRGLDADVIAVQELIADGAASAEKRLGAVRGLRLLAEAVGRQYRMPAPSRGALGDPAVAVGGIIHHTGLLWREGIEPIPGSLHQLERDMAGMWHCAVSVVFDLGGPKLRVGSVHLSPFDQQWGARDASQILRVFNSGPTPGIIGGDLNGIGADPAYDPDPYADAPWHPDHAFQLDPRGQVDRSVGLRLERTGRMQDCARLADAPWAATTGHHPDDPHPPRRIDRWMGSWHLPEAAVAGFRVIGQPVGSPLGVDPRLASDHLPIEVTIDADQLVR